VSMEELGIEVSKLNLKREDWAKEDAVRMCSKGEMNMEGKVLPVFPVVMSESEALSRKFMLSTETWNVVAWSLESISTSSRNPSTDTYVLFDGMGFLVRYLLESK